MSPGWERLHSDLQRLIIDYPELHRREVAKGEDGRFVYAKADAHGIGNRVYCVIGGFVVALLTNRALIIEWDSRDSCPTFESTKIDKHGENRTRGTTYNGVNDIVCDPVRIDDLFDAPYGIDWRGTNLVPGMDVETRCPGKGKAHPGSVWVIRSNQDMINFRGLFDADFNDFYETATVLCIRSDRPFYWAATCNPRTQYMFPDPWSTLGAFQQYLLRPTQSIRERVQAHLYRKSCLAGVHLRKVRKVSENTLLVKNLLRALENVKPKAGHGVFIASDPYSMKVKHDIENALQKRGIELVNIKSISAHPTRSTWEGLIDAAVENTYLGFCDNIFPHRVGFSTYHDIAFARMVWRHAVSAKNLLAMIKVQKFNNETATDAIITPNVTCYYPWSKTKF
eukprot:CAMPEP_0197294174 /NCGR_PEP_ID=MMETSP0890-20130614/31363_1 /TAXON_ID=44058 ORGANISM="Aureoumbra lagunensis, Strain CCMP1510" /NCGR_SAMPLE_ID=MMETSP0890 /ASSEMBLY_ACC=CAM_ASM_000533 /LENGTH=394 /DNA_ID=CAMNT_0042769401 /DNA_START=965 /DNA_END=2149 /DNA_ORIENTATION=+